MADDPIFLESPEQAYFKVIEEMLVRWRGASVTVRPADWHVAARWYEMGIPLDLIDRVIGEVVALRKERKVKGRLASLHYCAPAVETAWEEIRELVALGETVPAPALDVPARLAALASALERVGAEEIAAKVRSLSPPGTLAETVERQLAALDAEMLERTDRAFGAEDLAAVAAEVEKRLHKLAGRLPAAEIENARERLRRQAVRRRAGLPLLSLFSPDAEPRSTDRL